MNGRTIGCPDAEAALLGCLLRLPAAAVLDLARRMVAQDLVDPRNRAVLASAAYVASQGLDPDPVLVLGHLRRLGLESSFTDDRPAGTYLLDLFGAAGVSASVQAYLQIVLEHSYRRRVVEAAQRLEQQAGALALGELQNLLEEEVDQLRAAAARARPGRTAEASVQAVA